MLLDLLCPDGKYQGVIYQDISNGSPRPSVGTLQFPLFILYDRKQFHGLYTGLFFSIPPPLAALSFLSCQSTLKPVEEVFNIISSTGYVLARAIRARSPHLMIGALDPDAATVRIFKIWGFQRQHLATSAAYQICVAYSLQLQHLDPGPLIIR